MSTHMSTVTPKPSSQLWSRTLRTVSHLAVWFYALLLALPLYFILISSFKNNTQIFSNGFGLPESWSLDNFTAAWTRVTLGPAMLNSAWVTVLSLFFLVVVSLPAAYGLARSQGRLGLMVERAFAAGFLIPGFAALVPTVLLAIALSLYRTHAFLVLAYVAGAIPLSVILLTSYMRAIPRELDESARIDGANQFQVIWYVYGPIVMPALSTILLINFINIWNEYLISLVILGPVPENRTVQVALPTIITRVQADYGVLAAGSVITLIPIYLTYLILRRRMEEALVQGAAKG